MTPNNIVDIVIPVYNDNPYLTETINSIFDQNIAPHWGCHVYIVDDGSAVPLKLEGLSLEKKHVSLVRLDKNEGASVARNTGARAGQGDAILFLDADCEMKHQQVLALLLEQVDNGYDACFGQIDVKGDGFWGKYQREVAKKRAKIFIDGDQAGMSTAIFMVKRTVFESVGGFDEGYHFGFEDRDLFISMIKNGANATLVEDALVYHNDRISLESVTKKLFKSAQGPASRFIKKHPDEYMKMPYLKADIRFSRSALGILVFLTKPIIWPMVRMTDWIINKGLLPYFIVKGLVRSLSGLAYSYGTYIAKNKS